MHVNRRSNGSRDGIASRETDAAIVRAHPTWGPVHRASGTAAEEGFKFVCYLTSLYTLELPLLTHKAQQPYMRMYVACISTVYRLLYL